MWCEWRASVYIKFIIQFGYRYYYLNVLNVLSLNRIANAANKLKN